MTGKRCDKMTLKRNFCIPYEFWCLLQSNVMAQNVPMYSEEWKLFDKEMDNNCEREMKKSLIIKSNKS